MVKDKMISNLVASLLRAKKTSTKEYEDLVSRYKEMRDGGDGGEIRRAHGEFFKGKSVRELHFPSWKDSDFQKVLEEIGEADPLSEQEAKDMFPHENKGWLRNFFDMLKGK